jgi:hypothetical protein
MVQLIAGKTHCALCAEIIETAEAAVGFPAFLRPTHRFSKLSDAAVHRTCFEQWSDHAAFEELYRRYREIWASRPANLRSLEEIEAWGKEAFKDF